MLPAERASDGIGTVSLDAFLLAVGAQAALALAGKMSTGIGPPPGTSWRSAGAAADPVVGT